MSLEQRGKTPAQDLEGKVQETKGNLTSDRIDTLAEGEKELDEQTHQAAEELREEVKHKLDE